jgi:putative transposase
METSPMDERVKFVAAMLEAEESFVELCERFGISRKQGYKWKERYALGGVEALADRSRAPHSHPHAVPLRQDSCRAKLERLAGRDSRTRA